MCWLADHENPLVRFGVTYGLTGQDDDLAISTLITLAKDSDREVRNWAVFGLGSQTEADSPAIREALCIALDDEDSEIRGEALVGLANRKDSKVVTAILREWERDEVNILSIEAARAVRDARLLDELREFLETLDFENDSFFKSQIEGAIAACSQG